MRSPRLLRSLLALTALLAAATASAAPRAADVPVYPAERFTGGVFAGVGDLEKAFGAWMGALSRGDGVEAFTQASTIVDLKARIGAANLFLLSDAAVALGREKGETGDAAGALLAADHAVMMAPDNPDAHFFRAGALLAADKAALPAAARSAIDGIKATVADKIRRDRFVAAAVRYVFLGTLATWFMTFMVMMWVHRRALLADLSSLFPGMEEPYKKALIGGMTLVAPLAVGGWLIFLLSVPLFLWPYLRRAGRGVIAIFSLTVLATPFALGYVAQGITLAGADTYRALYQLSAQTWDNDTKEALERAVTETPRDPIISFALGLLHKRRGDKESALIFYDRALGLAKNDPALTGRTLVNKGNVHFVAREYPAAVALYQEAIRRNPNDVYAHFNLSNTYLEMVRTNEGEASYRRAMGVDPKLTNQLLESTGEEHDRRVIDITVTPDALTRYEAALAERTAEVTGYLWNVYLGPLSVNAYWGIGGGYLLLLLLSGVYWSRQVSHQVCATCGAPFRPPIALGGDAPRCNQCVAAQSSARGGVSSAKKDKKRMEIRDHTEGRSKVAGLLDRLLPGLGRVYYGESLTGLLFTFLTSLILTLLLMSGVELAGAEKDLAPAFLKANMLILAAGGVYWALMNTLLRREFY
ncbi:MAG: tetratricopeptide repeat protein [Nitrospinae bacterium]|nr:tetratricopeptide repeat protein [Nitrospinota bacterium]